MNSSPASRSTGEIAAAISNEVVRILHAQTGRGPTQARTTISGDLVACVLHDTLTVGERTLVNNGQAQTVLDVRKQYQAAMRTDLVAAIETHTGRKVIAFMSDNNIDPDTGIEAFLLEPQPGSHTRTTTDADDGTTA
jgi:uncharacterized protein YbcI